MKILGGIFEKNSIEEKLEKILQETSKDNFWKDQKKVKNILKEKKFFEDLISSYKNFILEAFKEKDINSLNNNQLISNYNYDKLIKFRQFY